MTSNPLALTIAEDPCWSPAPAPGKEIVQVVFQAQAPGSSAVLRVALHRSNGGSSPQDFVLAIDIAP